MADNNSVVISLVVKDGNASAVIAQVHRNLAKLGDGSNTAARGLHSSVSAMQASSAALRDLNGDLTHNIRAVERFITTIPGVGAALKAAFPVIGGLAFGAMLISLGEKLVEFQKKMRELPQNLQQAFDSMRVSVAQSTDEMVRHTDETNDKINVLLGKRPENGAKIAIDDIRIAADQAAMAALNATKQITSLIEANKISSGESLLSLFTSNPTANTNTAQGTIRYWSMEVSKLRSQAQLAAHNGDTAGAANLSKQARDRAQAAIDDLTKKAAAQKEEFANLQASAPSIKVSDVNQVNELMYTGAASQFAGDLDQGSAQENSAAAEKRMHEVQDARRLASEQAEAARKADQERLRKYQETFELRGGTDAGDKYAYWRPLTADFKAGSEAYMEVVKNYTSALKEVMAKLHEQTEEASKLGGGFTGEIGYFGLVPVAPAKDRTPDLSREDADTQRGITEKSTANIEYLRNLNESTVAAKEQALALRAVNIEVGYAQGSMSRYSAVLATNQLHADQYAEAARRLKDAIVGVEAMRQSGSMSEADYKARSSGLTNELGGLDADRAAQVVQDSAAIDDTKLGASFKRSLDLFVQESRDAAKQIGDILTSSMGSVNESLATAFTAYYHTNHERVRALREGLASDVRGGAGKLANYGLQKAEGAALGKLGFGGKPDGTSTNPLYVRLANALSSAGALAGSTSSNAFSKVGGWLSQAFGAVSHAFGGGAGGGAPTLDTTGGADPLGLNAPSAIQGFFANGGDVVANRPAIIGERGPELFMPHSAGTIVPNERLGGDTHFHFNPSIDARGATDPAAVHAAATRAVREAAPQLITATLAAHRERNLRVPSSRRI